MASKKEPPFFNEDNMGPLHYALPFHETMQLFVETLTGRCFGVPVSPFETIISVKTKIQRLEGIPVSQQHLIWNNVELKDAFCLNHYNISEGCTLQLILAMRGGPINTRRVPVEDPIREMTECMDPSRDDIWEKGPSSKQIAFLILQEGEQVNFFLVVDRGDGTITPLSESLSGGSIYNLYTDDDEDAEISPSGQQIIENSITMNKMKLLKAKMENMNLGKKPKKTINMFPHPPVAPRPSSGSVAAARHRFFQALPRIGPPCLPSPGNSFSSELPPKALSTLDMPERRMSAVTSDVSQGNDICEACSPPQSVGTMRLVPKIPHIEKEADKLHTDNMELTPAPLVDSENSVENCTPAKERGPVICQYIRNADLHASEEKKECDALAVTEENIAKPCNKLYLGKGNSHLLRLSGGDEDCNTAEHPHKPNTKPLSSGTADASLLNSDELSSQKNMRLSPLHCSAQVMPSNPWKPQALSKCFEASNLMPTASTNVLRSLEVHSFTDSSYARSPRYHSVRMNSPGKRPDFHSKTEAGEIAEVAIKASKEPVVSVNNVGFLTSVTQSPSRDGLQSSCGTGRFRTPGTALATNIHHFQEESFTMASAHNDMPGYFLSPGLGLNGNVMATGKRIAGDVAHFPPVNKKKPAKHCCFCGKKTGLATSYECRCGNNFCATHRYAETHSCTYDYKNAGRRYLQESNPAVSAPKLPKI